jgi:hypothetical protein
MTIYSMKNDHHLCPSAHEHILIDRIDESRYHSVKLQIEQLRLPWSPARKEGRPGWPPVRMPDRAEAAPLPADLHALLAPAAFPGAGFRRD